MNKAQLYKCIICVGSNYDAQQNINKLEALMGSIVPGIRWGEAILTEAEEPDKKTDMPTAVNASPYINRAAEFYTSLTLDELNSALKNIEKCMGRTAQQRTQGIVPIDIDVLIYNGKVVRPSDIQKSYVQKALKHFGLHL